MIPRLLQLQKSSKESAWGIGVELRHCRAWIHLYITRGTEE
jgi:hypothetical protein